MLMRSFEARNVQEAMQMAREEMGDEAVILSTDTIDKTKVIVTFALDRMDDEPLFEEEELRPDVNFFNEQRPPQAPATQAPAPSTAHHGDIGAILRYHATPEPVIARIMDSKAELRLPDAASFAEIPAMLTQMLKHAFRFDPLPLNQKGFRLILVGPPGSGKTMTAAKIAAKLVVDNQNIRVISTDSKRAGGSEQLAAFTKILGIDLDIASDRDELKSILADCDKSTRIIIDSAGCNPYDFQELKEVGEFATLADLEPVLVCAAGTEAGEAEEIAGVFSFLDISRVLVTRTDCARRFGSMLALAAANDYAFSHATSSPRAMGDLQPLDAALLSQLLTQYQRERIAA